MIEGWTDDFSKFKQKIEPLFGRLELLAEEYPDVYCHQVLSHGFMEYAGVRNLYDECKDRVKEVYEVLTYITNSITHYMIIT